MKAKVPHPLHYPDRTCWFLRENGQYCGCYAEDRSCTDGHPYCPRHYALLSPVARGEYDRSILPRIKRNHDGTLPRLNDAPQTVKTARNATPTPRQQGKRRTAQDSLL